MPILRSLLIALPLLAVCVAPVHAASHLQIVEASASGLVIDVFTTADLQPDDLHVRGEGDVALPMVAELLASPPGSQIHLDVRSLKSRQLNNVALPPADSAASDHPGVLARSDRLGIQRGVEARTLQIFPYAYDAAARRLTVHEQLRLQIRFSGKPARRPVQVDERPSDLHRAFINPPSHDGWQQPTPAGKAAGPLTTADWYDPALPWVKVFVDRDGIHRIHAARLQSLGIDPASIDLDHLRLVHLGVDHPLLIRGGEDGRFDEEDEILFVGRYRRAPGPGPEGERDHESEYGARETYWLTWDGARISPDFDVVSGAPTHGYERRDWYLHTEHFEQDQAFAVLEEAPDSLADRWFWQNDRPLKATDPGTRASQIITRDITGLVNQGDAYEARLRVSLTGETPAIVGDHHAFLTFNNQFLSEAIWSGQTSYLFDEVIPSALLADRNRILFQALADLSRVDHIWFNWFELTYRRQFHAHPGELSFATEPAAAGHRITVEGFRHPDITLFDVATGRWLTDIEVNLQDSLYSATFEDAPTQAPTYVVADSLSMTEPILALDTSSDLRITGEGAHMLIISSEDFVDAAERLADHRRQWDSVSVRVISVQDVFDEYNHGRFAREPLADFMADVYQRWTPRPAVVLLFGDATWDYRGIRTGRREQQLVPTLFYNARSRGYSPSDYLFSLVDGDDLLGDFIIGRLTVDSAEEADLVVDKVIDYDRRPAAGDWTGRVILAANWHAVDEFSRPSDSLYTRHMAPVGLRAQRFYAPDEEDIPNVTGKGFLDALNEGALIANFSGHGAAATMQYLFSAQFPDWDYMSQVANGPRLPLVTALSCLNGLFTEPTTEGLSEQFVESPHGGAIAYISASATSFTSQNDLLANALYEGLLGEDRLSFGAALTAAKTRVLTVHPGWIDGPLTMQLAGDPMQRLALPTLPDYVARDLHIETAPVFSSQVHPILATVSNGARRGTDSVRVRILDTHVAGVDTLVDEQRPAFVGDDTLRFQWRPLSGGDHSLSVHVDATDLTTETDEANNLLVTQVEVLVPREAVPLWPAPEAISVDLRLQALTPLDDIGVASSPADVVEFALSTTGDFPDRATVLTTAMANKGLAEARAAAPAGTGPGDLLYWRTRLIDGVHLGPWSQARALRWTADPIPTADSVNWAQDIDRLQRLSGHGLRRLNDQLVATALPPPFRPNGLTREIGFTVLSLPGAGVLATDGVYLYAKRWFNDPSTIYEGRDRFARIGTGFGGTIQGGDYGLLADSTTAGIAATWHEGAIYSDAGMSYAVERLDPSSGRLDTVAVPDGLLDWLTGRVVTDEDRRSGQVLHALFTSDGQQIYNVSMSSTRGTRVGWGVRVFDVETDGTWRLARDFIIPPTEDGFTFRWTDGVIADGERLYLIEYAGERRIRMVDAIDGSFLDEWSSDQDVTRVITGQYDPLNDLVWLGDLRGSGLFGYTRDGAVQGGELVTGPIGPAAAWHRFQAEGDQARLQVEGQQADGAWATVASASAPIEMDLASIDAARYPFLRLRAQIGPDTTQTLAQWQLAFEPAADLALSTAAADVIDGQLLVQAWVRNQGLTAAGAATLSLEQAGRALAQVPVRSLPRGGAQQMTFDPMTLPASGAALVLRLQPSTPDAAGDNDALELILTLPGLTTITFLVDETGQRLMDGDVVRGGTVVRVLAPPLAAGELNLTVDEEPVTADSSWTQMDGSLALRYEVPVGRHRLQARLQRDGLELGVGELELQVDDKLRIGNVLVSPHPLRSSGAFTWVASHAAQIQVDIFALSGRQIRRLGPQPAGAGFGQLTWDRRDADGRTLAAGTYLYVLTATDATDDAIRRRHRGALVLLPQ